MNQVRVGIHRFFDKAAVSFLGVDGETVYLDAKQAKKVAAALNKCAREIRSTKFSSSTFAAVVVEPTRKTKEQAK